MEIYLKDWKECIYNGDHYDENGKQIECECDECDEMIGCLVPLNYDIKKIDKYLNDIAERSERK